MTTDINQLHNMNTNVSNTQLEKKFDEYSTLESDRHDIRKIFQIADDEKKLDIIKYIDLILLKFNKIHKDVLEKQINAIDKWVEDILANLSVLRNDDSVIDVLAELD